MPLSLLWCLYLITLCFLSGLYFILCINTTQKLSSIGQQTQGNKQLKAVQYAQTNFSEYVPISLILLASLAALNIAILPMFILCLSLIIARLLHALSALKFELQAPPSYRYRRYGLFLNLFVNAVATFYLFVLVIQCFLAALNNNGL